MPQPQNVRVLVVDDAPFIADYLRLILEGEGYKVETAASTVSAMRCMEEREFSLAVVDLVLPDGDGLHLLRLLKSKDPSLEVIIMTGDSSIAKAVEATKQGAFYFVSKPFHAEEMLILVGNALERRRLVVEISTLQRKLAEQSGHGLADPCEALQGPPARATEAAAPPRGSRAEIERVVSIVRALDTERFDAAGSTDAGAAPTRAQLDDWECRA